MSSRPRVSVILAAYNVEKYVEKAVTSALKQTMQDLEVIVVDDASSDETCSVIQAIDDPRLKLLESRLNSGPSYSRNLAISRATGDWIAILDADDWWAPNRLEILLGVAEQEGAQIVADDLYLIQDGAEVPWDTYFKSRERVIGRFDKVTEVSSARMIDDDYGILQPIIRRDFLVRTGVRYKEHLRFAEDYVFVLDCLVGGAKMVICPEAYYYYRSRVGSLTKTEIAYTELYYNLLLELVRSQPYASIPPVAKSLRARLSKQELALHEVRVKELSCQKNWVKAAWVVVNNPALFISYARRVKRNLLQGE